LGLAVALAAALCPPSRRTRIDDWLDKWGSLYLRCFLPFTILYYAAIKIVRQHFPFPLLERFLTPFGGSSPQGLLWPFMGYSRGYSFIAGALELLGATLLLFRRTAAGGALILTAVLANVVVVNVFYDGPVKLLSIHLFAIAVFFLFPTLGRLADVLLLDRDSQAPLRLRRDPTPRADHHRRHRALRRRHPWLQLEECTRLREAAISEARPRLVGHLRSRRRGEGQRLGRLLGPAPLDRADRRPRHRR